MFDIFISSFFVFNSGIIEPTCVSFGYINVPINAVCSLMVDS